MAYIDQDTFCEAWNSSASVQECADKLGIAYGTASNRATRLRKRGAALKRIVPPYRPVRYTMDELLRAMRRRWRKGAERPIDRLWAKIERGGADECWMWTGTLGGPNHTGFQYGTFGVNVNGREINWKPHRLIWALDRGRDPKGLVIRHTCDVPLCCNPRHLTSGTQVDNVQDKVNGERQRRGADVNTAKLTPEDVLAIRASDLPTTALARRYGVNPNTVWKARVGRYWKHLPMPKDSQS